MSSCLKSEAAIRHVLSSGQYSSLKSFVRLLLSVEVVMVPFQSNVKFKLHHVDLLKKVVCTLEPFLKATQQLSRDDACVSEVPFRML